MEAQLQRPSHGHHNHEDAGLHSVEGAGERERQNHNHDHDHGEKKSVLKKVKEKAKKIKETIKKHGHGHDDDQGMDKHRVHGAPMYESTVVRSKNVEEQEHKHHHHVRDQENNPNTVGLEEDPHAPNNTPLHVPPSNYHPTPSTGGKEAEVDRFHNSNVNDTPTDTVAGKISSATCAVADKAISAKNAVASKLGYSGGGNEGEDSSMQAYLSDKFRPGEEDKALSEAITDALHKQKEAVWRWEEQQQAPPPPRGKVTMSKEVAERLGPAEGSKREGEDALAAGEESSGQGVTDRLKDAVSSWLGKSDGIQTAQDSVGNAFVNNSAASGDNHHS